MTTANDLSDRLMTFAVRVVRLTTALPKNAVGRHVGGQILRSGTSAGANYAEARGAESRADFVHKLGVVLKELKECRFWLELVCRTAIVKPTRVQPMLQECEELCAIAGRSVLTAKSRR